MKSFFLLFTLITCTSVLFGQTININSKGITAKLEDAEISIRRPPFQQGDIELSFIGNFGKETIDDKFNGSNSSYDYSNIGVLCGYYIIDGLSVEPELGWYAQEHFPPSFSGIVNGSYTQRIKGSIVAPFLRIGCGIGNGESLNGEIRDLIQEYGNHTVRIFNCGGGIKIIITPVVLIRAEVKYKVETFSKEVWYSEMSTSQKDVTFSNLGLYLGFSVVL